VKVASDIPFQPVGRCAKRGTPIVMGNYRFLNAWAEREQRRFDQQRAHPPVPGSESRRLRILQASITVFNMIAKFVVLYPIYIFLIVKLVSEHTVPSLLLAVVFLMLFGFSIFTTSTLIRLRRERGENWFTGLAPKMRSE
jgi:hypothetical protein